jgi:hypothetical protein
MSDPDNPFDTSIPDPFDPEQMVEDPLHCPSAVHRLLEIPDMPLGNGTYYQPGGFYVGRDGDQALAYVKRRTNTPLK